MPSKFRNSFTQKAGHEPGRIVQGRVVNYNLVKWTVDVVAQYDRKKYFNVQVGSPYLHHSNGEGVYAFPEVNATCMVCLPSDSSPPFVQCFVMAHELVNDSSTDAPLGTSSHGQPPVNATDASFAGGRPPVKPGDIWLRGRDGNFVILHRGGVLSVGATELAQRIYIPLQNVVHDVSENYEHDNAGGTIRWGIQDGPSKDNNPVDFFQTFRIFANDAAADVKVSCGKVVPIAEPDGGVNLAEAGVGQGDGNPIIYEVMVSPKGFVAESGDISGPGTVANSVMKFTFDRQGNVLTRFEGNFFLQVTKKLTLKVTGDVDISTQGAGSLTAQNGFDIDGGEFTHVKGKLVRLGAGGRPVAGVGDIVSLNLIVAPVMIQFAQTPVSGVPIPATMTTTLTGPLVGQITSGNNAVLI